MYAHIPNEADILTSCGNVRD